MRDPSIPEPRIERIASRLDVQTWFQVAFSVLAVFALVSSVIGAIFITRTVQITNEIVEKIQPAMLEASRAQAALLDQQNGARGYALTFERDFLQPYTDGLAEQREATAQLRALAADHPAVLEDIDAIEAASNAWRAEFAEPLIATVDAGDPTPVDPADIGPARDAFNEIRAMFATQNGELTAIFDAESASLQSSRAIRDGVLVTMVVSFILTGLAMVVAVHHLVAVPLNRLRQATWRVAEEENFGQHIYPQGPKDIRELATDVETMRGRIADELTDSRRQQQQLTQQAADLDAQAEELRRSNVELEQFAYVASHDLQEPLRKVASFCQLLERRYSDKLDEKGLRYIEYAVDGASRMQHLIDDLLKFSRVGRVHDDTREVELRTPLDKATSNLFVSMDESQARIDTPDEMPTIMGDSTLLTMLWQNLLGNAIKFRHPDRSPVVDVRCERENDEMWQFSVSDNGMGIGADFAEKVFVIFQRLHAREEYPGTGIGLALCKKIVEYHGGRIWLDTEYTDGARICFTLPALPEESAAAL